MASMARITRRWINSFGHHEPSFFRTTGGSTISGPYRCWTQRNRHLSQTSQLFDTDGSIAKGKSKSSRDHAHADLRANDPVQATNNMGLSNIQAVEDSTSSKLCRLTSWQGHHLEQNHQSIDAVESIDSSARTWERPNPTSLNYNRHPKPEEDGLIQLTGDMESLTIRVTRCSSKPKSNYHTHQQSHNVNTAGQVINLLTSRSMVCNKDMKIDRYANSGNAKGTQYHYGKHVSRYRCHGLTGKGRRCRILSPKKRLIKDGLEWYCFQHDPSNRHLRCQMNIKSKGRQCKIICSGSEIRADGVPICNNHFKLKK
ncbi:hypothetical protein BCR41DRAFT_363719 [Lobosporangium transversale]|uniref:Uncharacterized protein n=1 Tax=Lobosporangium transversale TaxID=64571 RepID=A0A1Y2G7H6_9FUNG|nr:hypothetical protein BCR41DRAFT_363719 [Lobosporangium transversale]ORY99775.1 hypothetical protein BCR41DRAFT_363719 [Lobosporangium transversale]|eukprot:XP_021876009.1 hypothetical protein BCR41DRAFT_363719 [Lobosporangium transversale]